MDMKTYIKESEVTDMKDINPSHQRITPEMTNLLHGAIGIATESGEILDALKRHIYYGKPLDKVNLKEEISDVMWYIALMLRNLDGSFEEIADLNIKKLRARFGDKFSEHDALNRDLDNEREIMENVISETEND